MNQRPLDPQEHDLHDPIGHYMATRPINKAFQVVKDEGLAIRVGEKRLVVIRDKVLNWINEKAGA